MNNFFSDSDLLFSTVLFRKAEPQSPGDKQ